MVSQRSEFSIVFENDVGGQICTNFLLHSGREVKIYRRNLTVAWTDVKKAYDSLYQEFIIQILEYLKVPGWIITWRRKAMSTWRTILQVFKGKENILSKEIFIECGIFQGDSLSPTLFGLAFIIISYTIRQMKLEHIPGSPGNRNSDQMKTHGLLMDDLKVYSTSHQQLEKVIQQAAYVMEKTGLNLGLDECSVLTIKAGKESTTKSVKITDEKIIEGLKEGKFYEYLGVSQRADCEDKVIKDALKKEFYIRDRNVWKSLLSAFNKVKAINSICVGVLSYSFGVINWTKVELEEMDIRVRKEMTMNKAFNKHSDTDRLYLARNRGGKGLICI